MNTSEQFIRHAAQLGFQVFRDESSPQKMYKWFIEMVDKEFIPAIMAKLTVKNEFYSSPAEMLGHELRVAIMIDKQLFNLVCDGRTVWFEVN